MNKAEKKYRNSATHHMPAISETAAEIIRTEDRKKYKFPF